MSGNPVLEVRALRKAYGDAVAVHEASLSMRPGEFLTLLGPSGSGKTTTLLSVAGFVQPDEGAIVLDGTDVSRVPPHRRDIGFVFQSYALFPHLSVRKNVAFPLAMRGIRGAQARRRVDEILDVVELGALAERFPRQLSGGQQQRVALARAMVFSPKLLLMDEPLGALDKRLRGTLQFEIKRLSRELGATVLYVTHDQEEAMAMSDRIAIFNEGRIAQIGTPEELYERPRSAFVAEFLGDSNVVPVRIELNGGEEATATAHDWRLPVAAQACADLGLEHGDPAAIALRPERIAIARRGDGEQAGGREVPGVVREIVYLGTTERIVVGSTIGDLIVHHAVSDPAQRLTPGDVVVVSWQQSHGVVVRA